MPTYVTFPPYLQKLQERQAMLQRCNLPEQQKEKWRKIVVAEMMSSEESDAADDDTIIVTLTTLFINHLRKCTCSYEISYLKSIRIL